MRLEAYSSVSATLEAYISVSAREGATRDPIGETRVLSPEEEVHSEFTSVAWESTGDTRRLSGTEEAATHALRGTDVRGAGEAVTANRVSRARDSGPVPSEASESQCSLIHQRSSHTGGGGASTRGAPPPGEPGEPRSDAPAKEGGQAARRGAHSSPPSLCSGESNGEDGSKARAHEGECRPLRPEHRRQTSKVLRPTVRERVLFSWRMEASGRSHPPA